MKTLIKQTAVVLIYPNGVATEITSVLTAEVDMPNFDQIADEDDRESEKHDWVWDEVLMGGDVDWKGEDLSEIAARHGYDITEGCNDREWSVAVVGGETLFQQFS